MRIWRSLFDDDCRRAVVARFEGLRPDAKGRWGRMSAPQMVAHLTDQMHHALGDSPVEARRSPLRWPPVRWLSIYAIPWPRGRIQGPPEGTAGPPHLPNLVRLLGLTALALQVDQVLGAEGSRILWAKHDEHVCFWR